MLGFSPLAGDAIGGSAVVREVVPADVTGIPASVTLGVLSLSTDATISDQAVRKPETVFFFDPNNDGVGVIRNNEHIRNEFINNFILGMRPQIPLGDPGSDNITIGPKWDEAVAGDNALSVQTKTTAELTSDPIVSQHSFAPLVNGDYTYPATYESSLGYDAVAKPVTVSLNHLPSESIVNNAATISTLGDPLLTTLVFPANDPTLFNAIVGQVRTINTFDPLDTVTYFYSLINGQVGEVQWPSENKHYLLQKYDTDKGFDLGTLSTNTFVRTKDHPFKGSAYTAYGFRLQPQVTTANFPDGTPVSQEHTLLVTSSLGVIKVNINTDFPALPITVGTNLSITPAIRSFVEGFEIATVGLPDPQWYLSTSRVEIIAEPNQPANDVIYPYASRAPTSGPTQTDFDFAVSLGVLDGPIGVDQPVDGFDTTLTLGTPTLKSLNTLTVDSQVVTISSNLSGIEAQVTEIIYPSDSILLTSSLGIIATLATSNAVCTSRLIPLGLGNITFAANANTAPSSSVEFTGSVGEITFKVDANVFPDGLEFVAGVGIAGVPALARITTAGFATVTIGAVGVGAGKLIDGFGIDVEFGPDLTATGFKFDFEAIKHLYNVLRQVHGGFPANRTATPTFSSPRNIRPPKPSKNLAA